MTDARRKSEPLGARHEQGCLFCRRHDGGFTSREHIFSEGLGNEEYVIEPGVVCDRCNNGPLSVADDALGRFPPIALLRAERGIPTKSKKAVVSKFGATQIWFSAEGELNVATNSKKVTRDMREGEGGKLHLKGDRWTDSKSRNLTRAIWKSALELIYWDHGPEGAFDEQYDDARAAILDVHGASGWAICLKDGTPQADIQLSYNLKSIGGRDAAPVRLSVFGVVFYTDLLRRDIPREKIDPPWPANVWVF